MANFDAPLNFFSPFRDCSTKRRVRVFYLRDEIVSCSLITRSMRRKIMASNLWPKVNRECFREVCAVRGICAPRRTHFGRCSAVASSLDFIHGGSDLDTYLYSFRVRREIRSCSCGEGKQNTFFRVRRCHIIQNGCLPDSHMGAIILLWCLSTRRRFVMGFRLDRDQLRRY